MSLSLRLSIKKLINKYILMRKLFLLPLILPLFTFSQFTYVPDDNFEQELINLGFDFIIDDYVATSNIDTVSSLFIYSRNISDLTGIEDFIALENLFCGDNNLTTLDLSNNPILFEVNCNTNQLTSIDVRNGNNQGLWYFNSMFNPSLNCIDVNDVPYAQYAWNVDSWTSFSIECNPSSITNHRNLNRKHLIRVVDLFGKEIIPKPNIALFYVFSDGSVEKKLFVK